MNTHGISEITAIKRQMIRKIILASAGMFSTQRWINRVLLQDTMAGYKCLDKESTANVMLEAFRMLRNSGKQVDCILSDNDPQHVKALGHLTESFVTQESELGPIALNRDYVDAIVESSKIKHDAGVILLDPFGTIDRPKELAAALSLHNRIDVAISIGATSPKRSCNGAPRTAQLRKAIQKANWYITYPVGRFQWTIMYGTNTELIRPNRSIGFFRVDSPEGQEACRIIDLTKAELEMMGIAPIRNTSAIQHSYQQLQLLDFDRAEFASRAASGM